MDRPRYEAGPDHASGRIERSSPGPYREPDRFTDPRVHAACAPVLDHFQAWPLRLNWHSRSDANAHGKGADGPSPDRGAVRERAGEIAHGRWDGRDLRMFWDAGDWPGFFQSTFVNIQVWSPSMALVNQVRVALPDAFADGYLKVGYSTWGSGCWGAARGSVSYASAEEWRNS